MLTKIGNVRRKLRAFLFGGTGIRLSGLAIRRSDRSTGVTGYAMFCERFAAGNDVADALTADEDFRSAATKAWFAVGYLTGLMNSDGPPDRFGIGGQGLAADQMAALLQWLKPVHDQAFDGARVDTATVLDKFESWAAASLAGEQFRRAVDPDRDIRTLTWELRPPLPLDAVAVARMSAEARQTVAAAAFALGQAHGRLPQD